MTKAAQQCREWILEEYPGTPIGRFACRNTASGGISQHSAYKGYDSNAIDVFGPNGSTSDADQAHIQAIVDTIYADGERKWSIRKILWLQRNHWNHAHIDFYPMITMKKWCGGPETPTWRYESGHSPSTVATRDPMPQNGLYDGEDMDYRKVLNVPDKDWARSVVDWGIDVSKIINVTDSNVDDWERDDMTDGRYWTFMQRFDNYLKRS